MKFSLHRFSWKVYWWFVREYHAHTHSILFSTYLPHTRIMINMMLIETTLEISCNSWNIASIPRTPLYQSQFFLRPHYWLRFLRFRDDALRTHSYNGCFYLTRWVARSTGYSSIPRFGIFPRKNYHKRIGFSINLTIVYSQMNGMNRDTFSSLV